MTTYTTLWTTDKETGTLERTPLGAFSDAAAHFSGLITHDVVDIKRTTRTVGKDKWTTIALHYADGTKQTIECLRA